MESSSTSIKSLNLEVKCKKCGQEMDRIKRPSFAKTFLFWLPYRRYFCYNCLRKRWAKRPHKTLKG
jgi:hypothetical protein